MPDKGIPDHGAALREVYTLRYALAVANNDIQAMAAAHRSELAALESQLAAYRAQVAGYEARIAREKTAQASTAALSEKLKNIETLEMLASWSAEGPGAAAPHPVNIKTKVEPLPTAPGEDAAPRAATHTHPKTAPLKKVEDLGRYLSDAFPPHPDIKPEDGKRNPNRPPGL